MAANTADSGVAASPTYLSLVPELCGSRLDDSLKSVPLGARPRLDEVPLQGWNVARGDLPFPVLTLDTTALDTNIDAMRQYCARHAVRLAPHGKTTMSPQLFAAQLRAGAWGMTAATDTAGGHDPLRGTPGDPCERVRRALGAAVDRASAQRRPRARVLLPARQLRHGSAHELDSQTPRAGASPRGARRGRMPRRTGRGAVRGARMRSRGRGSPGRTPDPRGRGDL